MRTRTTGWSAAVLSTAAVALMIGPLAGCSKSTPPAAKNGGAEQTKAVVMPVKPLSVDEKARLLKSVKGFVEAAQAKEDAEGAGGYAREVSAADRERHAAVIAEHLARADVCIASALVPGRRAPILVSEAMAAAMRPGSVIVDLAAAQGGNCALTEPGRTVVARGVTVVGETDLPSRLPVHASQMYSRNMEKLLLHASRGGAGAIDLRDEILSAAVVTRDGAIVHPDLGDLGR
jgi:NAD(P) transhydrogenase subunit alpha